MIRHPISPVWDKNSIILILGSFPSVKSREQMFFYGHPQNRFWRVMSNVLSCPLPVTVEEKRAMLISHGIALWDVIASCDITGSSDSSIKNVTPNDLSEILRAADISAIFTNGKTAHNLYQKYTLGVTGRDDICLPSTSPANAAWSLDRLMSEWRIIINHLHK
ncbi:MAG: DNA-deoxyinosine glycosylase [Clostridia bacterium]|nr:DNA-deoxyinosine glycosylase [Clostridia bacterium]